MIAPLLLAALLQAPDSARLTLATAVERALATHPAVGAARALKDRAAADVAAARAARRPGVSLDGSLNQFELPMVVAPLHGFDARNPPLFDRTLVQAGLSLGWTVYDFGVRAARVEGQRALEDAAGAALMSAEQRLVARTVGAYLRVLTARSVLDAHDQRLRALEAASARMRQLLAQGKVARVEGLRVDAEARRADADRIAAAAQLDVAEHELAQLARLPLDAVRSATLPALRLTETAWATDTSRARRAALAGLARVSSSDVQEFTRRERAASALLAAARAARGPEVRVQSAWVDRGRWARDFAAEWQLGLALSYPLYSGGARASAIARAAAEDRAAAEQVRAAQDDAELAANQALAALRESHARAVALDLAAELSAEVARVERLALDVGSSTQTQYLDAEANLLRARASLVEARNAEIAARVALARILGELSREWLGRTLETVR